MNKLNKTQNKNLAHALFDWRGAYKALETDPEVEKARLSVKRAALRLEKIEAPHREAMATCKSTIETIMPDLGESVTAFGIRAKYTAGYIRATYDRAVLDRLAAENVRIKNLIMPHRKESEIKPRISVEVADSATLLKEIRFATLEI